MLFIKKNIKLVGALTSKPYAFSARSWELEKWDFVDFYDSILSNISIDIRGLSIMRVLPRINEELNEEWISDKIRFSYDGFRRQRLLNPLVKDVVTKTYIEISWEEAFFNFYFNLSLIYFDYLESSYKFMEIIYGKFLDLESLISSKFFFKNFANLKTLSNFENGDMLLNNFNFNYLSTTKISELNFVDFFLLINTNMRYENPILHLKLLRSSTQGSLIFSYGCLSNMKFKTYSLGNSAVSLMNFLKGKNKYSLLLSKSKKSLIIIGQSLRQRLDYSNFSNFFNFLKSWIKNLNFMFTYVNSSLIGGLSLGLYDNLLERKFFKNKVKDVTSLLYLYNSDDISVLNIEKYKYIVYQGHHGDYGAGISNLIFPSTFVLERKGTFLNMEGFFINYNFIIKPAQYVRTDWRIFSALSLFLSNLKKVNILSSFDEVGFLFLNILPQYKRKRLIINNYNNVEVLYFYKLYNSLFYSFHIEYFLSDSVSRASRVMSVAASRFKNSFFNF